ncbi:MAG: hypothetical protein WD740_05210 [Anaerolineales bacterium]
MAASKKLVKPLTPFRRPLILCLAALVLAACSSGSQPSPLGDTSPYIIEPVFQEFYDFLGGQNRLGLALTPVIIEGNIQKQYVDSALLLYNPGLPPSEQYSLAPLGDLLGVWDQPVANADLQGALVVDGYIVYEGFASLYEELGGRRYVGKPLTGVRYAAEQDRVEQYFQNLGFFMQLDEPGRVRLIAYGQLTCGAICDAPAGNPAAIIKIELPYGEPFISTVSRLGDGFVGSRLAGPYQAADGSLEVIYENLVLYASPNQAQTAAVRPILALIGIAPDPMVTLLDNPNILFYGIDGEFGYNVPIFFSDYIAQHGGFELFGQPIAEIKMQADGSATQCYANACLRYAPGIPVTPLPMGAEYKARVYDQPAAQPPAAAGEIRIRVWEDRSQISSAEQQVIHASLFAGTQLLAGLQPYLELSLPGGSTSIYQFPPSDAGGQTQIVLPPVRGQNGTLVPYKVCLEGFGAAAVCASESYMIWGN